MKPLSFISLIFLILFPSCEELDPGEPGLLVPRTVDQDSSLPSVEVNGTLLHAETFGDPTDPMVVVLHGGPGGDYRYLLNCKAIALQGYFVVFYDQRGSGLSKRESKSSYSIQLMLDDLAGVIAHYRSSSDQKVILLGHSWGAMLASAFINQNPTDIAGAILAEPGGLIWDDVMDYVGRVQDYGLTSETLNDATFLDQFFTGSDRDHEQLDYKFGLAASPDASRDNPSGNEDHVPYWRMGAVVNRALFEAGERDKPNWTTNLAAYGTKILFVYSERNRAYGNSYARHVSSAYPNTNLARIDGAGHDMLTFPSGWNQFLPIALTYLNEISK